MVKWEVAKPLLLRAIQERVESVRANRVASRRTFRGENLQEILTPKDIEDVKRFLTSGLNISDNANTQVTTDDPAAATIEDLESPAQSPTKEQARGNESAQSLLSDGGNNCNNSLGNSVTNSSTLGPRSSIIVPRLLINAPKQLIYCDKCRTVQDKLIQRLKSKPDSEADAVRMLERMKALDLEKLCHEHLRALAGNYFGLRNNHHGTNRELLQKLETVYKYRHDLPRVRRQRAVWFRKDSAKTTGEVESSPYMWKPDPEPEFDFDAPAVFNRFAGRADAWDIFQRDGTINLDGFFAHLVEPEIFKLVKQEFDMYKYHCRDEINGLARMGWIQGMFYSLTQQVARQDPGWWAMIAAARPDNNWKLISYPYYTKDTTVGESTGFAHFDINVQKHVEDRYANNLIQGSLSLDDETCDNCTVLVKGFHHVLPEWYCRIQAEGLKAGGRTTNASNLYSQEDSNLYGPLEPVPCCRGGIRITQADILHGSTCSACNRRRTLFVWHYGIRENHKTLDLEEAETWSQLSACHSGFIAPKKSTSGEGFRYGRPTTTFPGTHCLAFSSNISEAMVGACRWDNVDVIAERNILLGPDDAAALKLVATIRARLIANFKAAFPKVMKAECKRFGSKSFFLNSITARPPPDGEYVLGSDEEEIEEAPLPSVQSKSKRKARGKGKGSMKKRRRLTDDAVLNYDDDEVDASNADIVSEEKGENDEATEGEIEARYKAAAEERT